MPNNVISLALSIIGAAITVAVTFYIKDYLEKRSEYSKLRKKLEKIAGKNASIIYFLPSHPQGMIGPMVYKITDIDKHGVTLENEVQTVFIPAAKLLQSEMILPSNNYDKARLSAMRKGAEEMSEAMFKPIMEKLIPAMRDMIVGELEMGEGESEISFLIGMKIKSALEESGLSIKRIDDKNSKK